MPFTYSIDSERGILFLEFTNALTIDKAMNAIILFSKDPNYKLDLKVLVNLKKCKINEGPDIVPVFSEWVKEFFGSKKFGKTAFLVDTPKETALSIFYQKSMEGTQPTELFNTEEAALAWLES